jgi:hypothetical protein
MTCPEVQSQLSLYLYGELDFAHEEAVEEHLAGCAFCTLALNREKSWHASLQAEARDVDLTLLSVCRRELKASLAAEKASNPTRISFWQRISEKFDLSSVRWSSRLAYASFLVLLGFGAGQAGQNFGFSRFFSNGSSGAEMASLLSGNMRVRDLRPSSDGRVALIVENVSEGQFIVSPDDPKGRALLVAATRDPENPAVRVESVQILMGHDGTDVRDALIASVMHDPNAAVRLKAVEALRHFSDDMPTREALESALQRDKDAAVRAEAIEVLAPEGRPAPFTPDLLKTLQQLAHEGQDDDYVRQRSRQLLDGAQSGGSHFDTY